MGQREFRVGVASPDGRRSCIWKFCVWKNDAYVITRMFGADAKVSLHASGECQWSATSDWVIKAPGRRNAERHITRWSIPQPERRQALHVFRVLIPESELRQVPEGSRLKSVHWLAAPPAGKTTSLECYITPPNDSDPAALSRLPYPHVMSLPFVDGRWFVVLQQVIDLSAEQLGVLRHAIWRCAHMEPSPEHRAAAFFETDGKVRGLLELCPPGTKGTRETPFHRPATRNQ